MTHDSDWFAGTCECNDFPCKVSVAAQAAYEKLENIRGRICAAYYNCYKEWPQSSFVDSIIFIMETPDQQYSITDIKDRL